MSMLHQLNLSEEENEFWQEICSYPTLYRYVDALASNMVLTGDHIDYFYKRKGYTVPPPDKCVFFCVYTDIQVSIYFAANITSMKLGSFKNKLYALLFSGNEEVDARVEDGDLEFMLEIGDQNSKKCPEITLLIDRIDMMEKLLDLIRKDVLCPMLKKANNITLVHMGNRFHGYVSGY